MVDVTDAQFSEYREAMAKMFEAKADDCRTRALKKKPMEAKDLNGEAVGLERAALLIRMYQPIHENTTKLGNILPK